MGIAPKGSSDSEAPDFFSEYFNFEHKFKNKKTNKNFKNKFMDMIIWNVNSIGSDYKNSQGRRLLIKSLFPDIMILLEPNTALNWDHYYSYETPKIGSKTHLQMLIKKNENVFVKQVECEDGIIIAETEIASTRIFIIGVYIHSGSKVRRIDTLTILEKFILNCQDEDKIIIGGDFNTNLFDKKNFSKIETNIIDNIKHRVKIYENTQFSFAKGGDFSKSSGKSLIDFVLSKNIDLQTKAIDTKFENVEHKMLGARFEVKNEILKISIKPTKIPDKRLATKMGDWVTKSEGFSFADFKKIFKMNKRLSKKVPKSKSPLDDNCSLIKAARMIKNLSDKELATEFYFKEFRTQVQNYFDLRSIDSHKAFNLLKKLSKYKISLDKRESDIANRLVINGKDYNSEKTKEMILETFKNNHLAIIKPHSCQNIKNIYINDDIALKIILGVQREKGFSFDCCNFSCFKICSNFKKNLKCKDSCEKGCLSKLNFVKKIFNSMDYINEKKLSDFFFKGRLIPLSKSGSNIIKNPGEIRPIIIVSYIIKVLESILLKPLKDYVNRKMISSQVGATDGGEVNQNILL